MKVLRSLCYHPGRGRRSLAHECYDFVYFLVFGDCRCPMILAKVDAVVTKLNSRLVHGWGTLLQERQHLDTSGHAKSPAWMCRR
jgi:hypothetical protein